MTIMPGSLALYRALWRSLTLSGILWRWMNLCDVLCGSLALSGGSLALSGGRRCLALYVDLWLSLALSAAF